MQTPDANVTKKKGEKKEKRKGWGGVVGWRWNTKGEQSVSVPFLQQKAQMLGNKGKGWERGKYKDQPASVGFLQLSRESIGVAEKVSEHGDAHSNQRPAVLSHLCRCQSHHSL